MQGNGKYWSALLCCPLVGLSAPVCSLADQAQPSATSGLEEVVVTATRRSESIQEVPLSITAVTAAALESRAATNFFDYGSSIPNLSFGYSGGGGTAGLSSSRSVAIRGIQGDGTTGFYIDDTPVPDSIDPKLLDVSQIEVLRGPQGTLYGALSMGGTVRILTQQPDSHSMQYSAHGSISGTNDSSQANYQVDGSLNLPLVDNRLALRLSATHEDLGGFIRNFAQSSGTTINNLGRSSTDAAQASVLWQVTDDLTLTPRILYQRTNMRGLPLALVQYDPSSISPIAIRPTTLTITSPFPMTESSDDEWSLTSLDVKYRRPWGTFVFSSSYFTRRTMDTEDQTVAIAQLFGISPIATSISDQNHPRVQTEEFRFSSSFQGPLQLVAGLYYQKTNTSGVSFPPNVIPGLDAATGGALGTDLLFYLAGDSVVEQKAPYAEINYDLDNHWRLTAGLRSSRIDSLTGPTYGDGIANGGPTVIPRATLTDTTTTPKLSLQYRFSHDSQVYATAAKGFRPGLASGGQVPAALCAADLQALGITTVDGQVGPVQPDTVWSYEVGEKSTWLDQRLKVNVDAFRINWNKIQQQVLLACGFPFQANAGAARSQGVEFDLDARLSDAVTMQLSGGYDDAKFTETVSGTLFQSGDRVPQVPRETVQLGADYHFPVTGKVTGFVHADYRYVGSSWSTNNSHTDPVSGRVVPLIRPSYRIADLRGGARWGKSEVAAFLKNLTNELANLSDTNAISLQAAGQSRVATNAPRTIGIEYRYHY